MDLKDFKYSDGLVFVVNLLHSHIGFYWEKTKLIGIPSNFFLLLPRCHIKSLFSVSTFFAQKETDGSVLSLSRGDIVNICSIDLLKFAPLGK